MGQKAQIRTPILFRNGTAKKAQLPHPSYQIPLKGMALIIIGYTGHNFFLGKFARRVLNGLNLFAQLKIHVSVSSYQN